MIFTLNTNQIFHLSVCVHTSWHKRRHTIFSFFFVLIFCQFSGADNFMLLDFFSGASFLRKAKVIRKLNNNGIKSRLMGHDELTFSYFTLLELIHFGYLLGILKECVFSTDICSIDIVRPKWVRSAVFEHWHEIITSIIFIVFEMWLKSMITTLQHDLNLIIISLAKWYINHYHSKREQNSESHG